MAYTAFFFSSRLSDRKDQFAANERKIAELKERIKEVEDFERRNKIFEDRNAVIEKLSKNKSLPVKVLNELSSIIPIGIWYQRMELKGNNISIDGFGFRNDEIVKYVNNAKKSDLFQEVYLRESKRGKEGREGTPLYIFKITFQVKA
jgi:type IV pilus assembly protein PilN